jgi:hypothetical protein
MAWRRVWRLVDHRWIADDFVMNGLDLIWRGVEWNGKDSRAGLVPIPICTSGFIQASK